MSQPIYEVDELLWERYISDCRADQVKPGMSDFLIWLDENGLDRPEVWDGCAA